MRKLILLLIGSITVCFGNKSVYAKINNIYVSPIYTTTIIFDKEDPVVLIKKGGEGILIQHELDLSNRVLSLKSKQSKEDFITTNILVVTKLNNVYNLKILYKDILNKVYFQKDLQKSNKNEQNTSFKYHKKTEEVIQSKGKVDKPIEDKLIAKILSKKQFFRQIWQEKDNIQLYRFIPFINKEIFYFKFQINNKSKTNYEVDYIKLVQKFFVANGRSTTTDKIIEFKKIKGSNIIKPNKKEVFILSFTKEQILEAHIIIRIKEKNGFRNLEVNVSEKTINRSLSI